MKIYRGVLSTLILALSLYSGPARGQEASAAAAGPGVADAGPRRVLLLTHSAGYRHGVLPTAEAVLAEISGREGDLEIVSWEGHKQPSEAIDLKALTGELLATFDGVLFFTTGELPLDPAQKQALLDFVSGGGAYIGVHSASDTFYQWAEYGELVGGYFRTHSWNHLPLTLKVEDAKHPATRMLGNEWTLADEFYRFGMTEEESMGPVAFSRERVHVLLSIDTAKSDISKQRGVIPGRFDIMEADGDYPLAWCREYGEGRSFYTALGHREDVWQSEKFQAHLIGGMRWALGLEE